MFLKLLKIFWKTTLILPVSMQLKLSLLVSKVRRFLIGPHGVAILTKGYNGYLLIDSSDFGVGRALAFSGKWDREIIENLLELVTGSSRVLIAGTHVGSLLIPLSKKVNSVTGIEANPETYEYLKYNLLLNGVDNVEVFNYAAGDKNGTIEFMKSSHNPAGSKIMPRKSMTKIFNYDNPEVIEVEMKRVDDIVKDPAFDLVIIDIEGAEYFALQGMPEILKHSKLLQIELMPYHLDNVAGVSFSDFISLIGNYFNYASVDSGGNQIEKKDFSRLLPMVYENTAKSFRKIAAKDVLFSKEPLDPEYDE